MKERPIIFKVEEVRAILAGRKTQARRIVKPQPLEGVNIDSTWIRPAVIGDRLWVREKWRVGAWREYNDQIAIDYCDGPLKTWRAVPDHDKFDELWQQSTDDAAAVYGQQDRYVWELGQSPCRWRPSILMPRWASRILLEVTAVRAERLQDISEADATAEGIESTGDFFECPCWRDYMEPDPNLSSFPDDPVGSYASLWESIYGPDSWAQNPWVWVIEFQKVEQK